MEKPQTPENPPFTEESITTIEKAVHFLRTIEEEFQAGKRTLSELIYFTNKVQGLFYAKLSPHAGTIPYEKYARFTSSVDDTGELVSWTEFIEPTLQLPNTEENVSNGTEIVNLLESAKTNLRTVLNTYRSSIGASIDLVQHAENLLKDGNTSPSEILAMTNQLLELSYR